MLDLEVVAAAAAGADAGSSSSLSGCSISRLFASGSGSASSLGVTAGVEIGENSSLNADLGSSFALDMVGVTKLAGADLDLEGSAGVGVTGVAVDGAGEGAEATGADDELMALVSRSINFGCADLPAKKSEADRAASADAAGGKILHCQLSILSVVFK